MKNCPYCAEPIKENAQKCKYCQEWLWDNTPSFDWNKLIPFLSYGWTVFVNILTVFIAIGIFNAFYGDFEKIVSSLLVLIYLNLNFFSSVWGYQKMQELFALNDEFKEIKVLLKKKHTESEDSVYENEKIDEAKIKFKRQQIKFYINSVFAFVIYSMAIVNLVWAL